MKKIAIIGFIILIQTTGQAQVLSLKEVLDTVMLRHPLVKMYDNEIRSMDEAAKGARSWMPPTLGVGQFMTPYNVNLWRRNGDMKGMGSIALSGEQMFPNKKKLNANEAYMKAMSGVEKEIKNRDINELIQDAKQLYYEWIVLQKKLTVVQENEKLLDFMVRNAEIRYKNSLGKISAYYKAKAALGNFNPGFKEMTAFQINPFIKYGGLEFFGAYEVVKGNKLLNPTTKRDSDGSYTQLAGELLYRFGGKEQFYLAGRYNAVSGKDYDDAASRKIDRFNIGGGYFLTKNVLAKLEYVSQKYNNSAAWGTASPLYGGKFNGLMLEATIGF